MNNYSCPLVSLGYLGSTNQKSILNENPTVGVGLMQSVNSLLSGKVNHNIGLASLQGGEGFPLLEVPPVQSSTQGPVFSVGIMPRDNIHLDKLLADGYIINHRMYENGKIKYLVGHSRAGDKLFIKLNDSDGVKIPKFESNDIQLERRSAIVLVPQETKMGVLQCLDYDICGAAFICNGSICVTEKSGEKSNSFTEENYIFRNGTDLAGGKIGRSLVAYPIVKLSQVLENPRETEARVANASLEIAQSAYARLRNSQQELDEAILKLQAESTAMKNFLRIAEKRLNGEIDNLTRDFNKIKDLQPEDLPAAYPIILEESLQKKTLRNKVINGMAAAYHSTGMVRSISNELRTIVDPVLMDYQESVGPITL